MYNWLRVSTRAVDVFSQSPCWAVGTQTRMKCHQKCISGRANWIQRKDVLRCVEQNVFFGNKCMFYLRTVLDAKKTFVKRSCLKYAYKHHEQGSSKVCCWLSGSVIRWCCMLFCFDGRGCGEASKRRHLHHHSSPSAAYCHQAGSKVVRSVRNSLPVKQMFPKGLGWINGKWDHLVSDPTQMCMVGLQLT